MRQKLNGNNVPFIKEKRDKLKVNLKPSGFRIIMESLILAQNERWRRVLSMQVEW